MSMNEKKVPKRRFKEFQNAGAWEQSKLGELADIVRGASPRPIQDPKWFDNENSQIGWLRISDVTEQNGRIRFLEQRISKEGQAKTRVLLEPHLLLSIAATVGKPVINYVKTGVHDGFLIFLNPKFDREYMFQWLDMFRPKWQQFGQPGSQVNLNSEIVRNAEITIPSAKEQQELGGFFAKLDKLITLHKRKLDKLKSLKKAYLTDMFPAEGESKPKLRFAGFTDDWKQRKLKQFCSYSASNLTANDTDINAQYDLYDANAIIGKTNKNIQKEDYITIIKDGSGVGRVRILPKNSSFIGTMGALKNEGSDINFLMCCLIKTDFTKEIAGATIPHIYFSNYGENTYFVPSFNEQIKVGIFFKKIDDIITLHQRKLEKLQNIKKAYLNEMFV